MDNVLFILCSYVVQIEIDLTAVSWPEDCKVEQKVLIGKAKLKKDNFTILHWVFHATVSNCNNGRKERHVFKVLFKDKERASVKVKQ